MLSAAIAYNELAQRHPETIARAMRYMKSHPQAVQFETEIAEFESESARAQALFMYMARWADDISSQLEYEHPKWHYVNIPYIPSDAGDQSQKPVLEPENILTALAANANVIRDPGANDAEKAIALCWLFHLVGDLHQPLHVVAMITPELPTGDRGGNLIFVKQRPEEPPMRLHAVWDHAATVTDQPSAVALVAERLTRSRILQRSKMIGLRDRPYRDDSTFERWAREESFPLAIRMAYQGGTLAAAFSEDRAVVLSSFYLQSAMESSVRRVVLSGYRLADVLTVLLSATSAPIASKEQSNGLKVPEKALLRARLKEFWQAVGAHDIEKRYRLTTPTVRARVSLEEFRKTWAWQERPEVPVQNMTAELTGVCGCVQLRLLRCTVTVGLVIETPGEPVVRDRTVQEWEFGDGQWYDAYSGAPGGKECPANR